MNDQATAKTRACGEYRRLFDACASAREILNGHRAEIYDLPSAPEATVDEVLRSQVKYAQAYALLRNHMENCFRCRSIAIASGA